MRIRITVISAVALYALMSIAPALADEAELVAFTESVTETTVADNGGAGTQTGIVPAVEAPPAAEEEPDAPWTQRFLAPTILVLGVLGLVVSAIVYGARVRGRYEVVD